MFNRRIRLAHFFQNYPPYIPNNIFPKSNKGWSPPPNLDPDIESFTHYLTQEIMKKKPHPKPHHNLSPEELSALQDLKQDDSIVIKPADKGGATVIWSKADYEKEALRQLNNHQHYIRTTTPLTYQHHRFITQRLTELTHMGHLPPNSDKIMINPDCRISPFYLLPKIHKKDIPGRPIVSGIDSPTDRISHTLDHIFRPFVSKLPSHIKDTRDFINKLQQIHHLHEDEVFVTIDVSSLYTSIPHEDGLRAIRLTLQNNPNLAIPIDTILELTEMTLTMNTFVFNGHHYHQIQGTAMGTKMAPSYANIFMGVLEHELLENAEIQPSIWVRFIDDIFAIYRGSEDEIRSHINYLNQFHNTIKFTSCIDRDQIDFLDVTVYRKPDNTIGTRLYTKPTNTGQYLNASSFHPHHQIESIAYSQALRLRLICSDVKDFDTSSKLLLKNLTLCGHNHHKTKAAIIKAKAVERETLLNPPTKPHKKIIPFIVTHTPDNRSIPYTLKQATSLLRPTPVNRRFLENRLIVAFRRSTNLRDILVHSEHPRPQRKSISRPCMRFNCKICEHVVTTNHITPSKDKTRKIPIVGHNTCDSFSVIYALLCPVCGHKYIGQTGRNIRQRLYEHKRNISKRDREQPAAKHFIDHDVQPHEILLIIIDNSAKDKNTRLRLEEAWIRSLDTVHPNGMNLHLWRHHVALECLPSQLTSPN